MKPKVPHLPFKRVHLIYLVFLKICVMIRKCTNYPSFLFKINLLLHRISFNKLFTKKKSLREVTLLYFCVFALMSMFNSVGAVRSNWGYVFYHVFTVWFFALLFFLVLFCAKILVFSRKFTWVCYVGRHVVWLEL